MITTTWSLDDGYGDIKGCNGTNTLLVPSAVTNYRPLQQSDFAKEKIDPYSHITVEVDGVKYLIGRGAMEQDPKLNWIGGENKHLDSRFPALLFGGLALMAGEEKNITLAPLVMGLPVLASESEERQNMLRQIALGKHNVITTLADGKTREVNITVKDLLCKKQPFGSYCDLLLDKRGDIADKKLAEQYVVVVDIGCRTLNIYTLDGLQPIYDLCTTTNDGIMLAYQYMGNELEKQLGSPIPEGRLPYIANRGTIRGVAVQKPLVMGYSNLANEIALQVETLLVNSGAMVDKIIFTGGGATLLKPFLAKKFAHRNILFLDRYATTRGFYKYGIRHARKNGMKLPELPIKEIPLGELLK